MDFNITLKFQPSAWFLGILAELNEKYSDWTDGSYDWADQTKDFLHNPMPVPKFDESLFKTPLSRRAVNDLLNMAVAIMAGNYLPVRQYLQNIRFAFVIGYPRSGGSYLVKELLRALDLDHKRVSEALAHDGFPELRDIWFDWNGNRPYYHLQDAIFQTAEFLVIANFYYQLKTRRQPSGIWLAPKKMHKMVNWGGSFKMLLGQSRADYIVTIRNPLPTAISIYEKSGGLPADKLFPARAPRSAIERWILTDLMLLGHSMQEISEMEYFDAVQISWSNFYARMATSGLFLGDRQEIRLISYGKPELEAVISEFRKQYSHGTAKGTAPEAVLVHDKSSEHPKWQNRATEAANSMSLLWASLGLRFPKLSME
jgi:hypothetical protein